jgi:oxalate---CoA ligase
LNPIFSLSLFYEFPCIDDWILFSLLIKVPTIHSILLSSPKPSPIPNIRFIRSCSSSLSPTVFHALESTFHAPVLEAYAMSEAAHMMTGSPLPHNGPRYPGSVGKPSGVQLTIRDPINGKEIKGKGDHKESRGEVCIRGKNVMLGYLNNEKANKEGYWEGEREGKEWRWFRTGDEGFLTEEGYLVLTGRLKEVSSRGAPNARPFPGRAIPRGIRD